MAEDDFGICGRGPSNVKKMPQKRGRSQALQASEKKRAFVRKSEITLVKLERGQNTLNARKGITTSIATGASAP